MNGLPPNIERERRTDAGTRALFKELAKHEEASLHRMEGFQEEVLARLEGHVTYKMLVGSVVTVATAIVVGVLTLNATTKSQVDTAKAAMESRIDKVDTTVQQFKADTGAEVKGIYRFLLEKQKPEVVRRDVENDKRENAPPPEPINPLAPSRNRR